MKKIIAISVLLTLTATSIFAGVVNNNPYPGMSAIWTNTIFNNQTSKPYTFTVSYIDDIAHTYFMSYSRNHIYPSTEYTFNIDANALNDKLTCVISTFKVTDEISPNPFKLTVRNFNGLENNYISYFDSEGKLFFILDPKGKHQLENIVVTPEAPVNNPVGSDQFYGKTIISIHDLNMQII